MIQLKLTPFVALLLAAPVLAADSTSSIKFKKIKLSDQFYSEGAAIGDFNKDGKMDFVAGQYWYEGPDFVKRHEYDEVKVVDPSQYSANFLAFTYDFNNDGWTDIFIIGFPGQSAGWFENPKGKDGKWERHVAWQVVDNESPTFTDFNGDGRPDLICNSGGSLGWAEFDPQQPTKKWKFHKVSPKDDRFQKFTHGIGVGDVNGDGKLDFLEARGWWENPGKLEGDPEFKFHPFNFFTPGHGEGGSQMYAYDVNGDGANDVVCSLQAHGCGLAWFENKKNDKGEITFDRHLILSDNPEEKIDGVQFSQLHALDLIDMNGDGLKDLVTGKRYWAHGAHGDIDPGAAPVLYWFELTRKEGKVKYIPHQIDDASGVGTQVMAGDINGDKKPDVVVGNKKGQFIFIQESAKKPASAAAK